MAGKKKSKPTDNFEKIRKEMTSKRRRAILMDNHKTLAAEELDIPAPLNAGVVDEVPQKGQQIVSLEQNKVPNEDQRSEMVVFRIGEEEFAISIVFAKEIIRVPELTRVPHSPHYIAGLCTLRGELLPVIDSRRLFGLEDKGLNDSSRIVIIDFQGKRVGLTTDRVSEVIRAEASMVKEPPGTIKGVDDGVVQGVMLLNEGKRLVMLLDVAKIVKAGIQNETDRARNILSQSVDAMDAKLVDEEQVIIFNVGHEEYALRIEQVKEIIRIPELTRIPNVPDYIEGVLSIRNQLLAVTHLGRLLGITHKNMNEANRVLLVTTGEITFGVIVDRVSQVMRVPKDALKKGFIHLHQGQRLVMLLDARKLITEEAVLATTNRWSRGVLAASDSNRDDFLDESDTYVIFKLDQEEYGMRISNVKEVNHMSKIRHLPGSPPFIDGMVNLRGEAIPVLNLRTLFGQKTTAPSDSSKLLVAEYGEKTIGIIIDSASEVTAIPQNLVEGVSEALVCQQGLGYMDGIARLNDHQRVVLLLNLTWVLSFL